jgi:hypothetical protein
VLTVTNYAIINRPRTKPINTPKKNSLVNVSIFCNKADRFVLTMYCFNIYCVVVDFLKLTDAVFHHTLRMIIRQTRISAH